MNRIAIVISTQNGHTRKIANTMAAQLRRRDVQIDVFNVELGNAPTGAELRGYDAIVIGSPVYLGDFSQALLDWTWDNHECLNSIPSSLFTVSLNAADPRPKARVTDDKVLRHFLVQTDFQPRFIASLAGALSFTQYSFFKKCVMQGMSAAVGGPTDTSKDFELTNWDDVAEFTQAFRQQDMRSPFATINRLPVTPEPLWPLGLARAA